MTVTISASAEHHAPLNSSLASLVQLELGEGREESEPSRGPIATAGLGATDVPSATLSAPRIVGGEGSPTLQERLIAEEASLGHQVQLEVAAQLVAQHRAEALLRQRQLEQLRQVHAMQQLSLLYPPTTTTSALGSSFLVEALLAQRQQQEQQLLAAAAAANAASAVDFARATARPSSLLSTVAAASSSNGAAAIDSSADKIAHTAPKRAVDKIPSELQGNKKQKREDGDDDDDDSKGHRFRPYQYEQWTEKFQELTDFKKVKGHCQVPHTYTENPPLARWVKRQRYQYKLKQEKKQSTMTDERVHLLEDIGFIWDSHAAAWAEKLHELKEYAEIRGDCNVPSTYPASPQLATWVKCQRRQYKLLRDGKTSNMTVRRIKQLEAIGFVWEVRKSWDSTRK